MAPVCAAAFLSSATTVDSHDEVRTALCFADPVGCRTSGEAACCGASCRILLTRGACQDARRARMQAA